MPNFSSRRVLCIGIPPSVIPPRCPSSVYTHPIYQLHHPFPLTPQPLDAVWVLACNQRSCNHTHPTFLGSVLHVVTKFYLFSLIYKLWGADAYGYGLKWTADIAVLFCVVNTFPPMGFNVFHLKDTRNCYTKRNLGLLNVSRMLLMQTFGILASTSTMI